MKALLVHEHGPIESLELGEAADPAPKPGEVVIDVKAASINFPDILVIGGTYQKLPPRPFSPGKDFAGVVSAIGEGVTSRKIGDRVIQQPALGLPEGELGRLRGSWHGSRWGAWVSRRLGRRRRAHQAAARGGPVDGQHLAGVRN